MNVDFKRFVISEISKMPFYHVSPNGISHTIKCPYCNDDSPRHGHFGLKIDLDSNDPILYNCFKCSAGGILNQKVLSDLNISLPQDLMAQMIKSNKVYARKNNLTDISVMPFEIPIICNYLNPAKLQMKSDYIRERIGLSLSYADAATYRIIFSFKDFIIHNKIDTLVDIAIDYLDYIDANYVGFLSLNKNYIIFRRVTNKSYVDNTKFSSMRYIKYKLDEKNMDNNNFYTIPTSFDIMSTTPINVHISEGPFDILSIMTNNVFNTNTNNLFFAVCGFGYIGVIKNIIKMGACPINLYVYADNDKSDRDIMMQLYKDKGVLSYINKFHIARNSFETEKDFGVPNNRIKPSFKKYTLKK